MQIQGRRAHGRLSNEGDIKHNTMVNMNEKRTTFITLDNTTQKTSDMIIAHYFWNRSKGFYRKFNHANKCI